MTKLVRTVDLFAGCGGLSLGFDLYRGSLQFETVLALDNDASALAVYNQNTVQRTRGRPTGRLADVTWFAHRSEALLYYLAHYAAWAPDHALTASLNKLGYTDYLQNLRLLDAAAEKKFEIICNTPEFKKQINALDSTAFGLAISKSVMNKLCIVSFKSFRPKTTELPWAYEYDKTPVQHAVELSDADCFYRDPLVAQAAVSLWNTQIERLGGAITKIGKGQHATVGSKIEGLATLLTSSIGSRLREQWTVWRATRDTLRAKFCLSAEMRLNELYQAGRQVDLLLGGPPCKGWSRIGRAVIESLREQGVHAWASHDYGDERNALLHNYVLFLDALRPSVFLFENVAHFESSLRTPSGTINAAKELELAVNALGEDSRYSVTSQVISARRYGIPQDRDRYIMIGWDAKASRPHIGDNFFSGLTVYETEVPLKAALLGLEDPGVFVHGSSASCRSDHTSRSYTRFDPQLPAAERAFISWIRQPRQDATEHPQTTDAHIVRAPRSDDRLLFRHLAPGLRWMDYKFNNLPTTREISDLLRTVERFQAKNRKSDLPSLAALKRVLSKLDDGLMLRLLLEGVTLSASGESSHHLLENGYLSKGTDRHGDWLERLSPDRPCKTIVAHIGKDTYGYIHPTQPRALSMREAARVQTFPDFFQFGNAGVVDGYSMIGNAVPPMLGHQFAASLAMLDGELDLFTRQSAQPFTHGELKCQLHQLPPEVE